MYYSNIHIFKSNVCRYLLDKPNIKKEEDPVHQIQHLSEIFIKFALNTNSILIMKEDINRIKVVLAEKKRTNKWLAEKLGKDPATVSKWCTNSAQPGLETLVEVARLLDVDVAELLRSSKING